MALGDGLGTGDVVGFEEGAGDVVGRVGGDKRDGDGLGAGDVVGVADGRVVEGVSLGAGDGAGELVGEEDGNCSEGCLLENHSMEQAYRTIGL